MVTNHNDTADHSYYLDLCERYCLLLGAQSDSRDEIVATKQELMRVIFEPARMLDIPAGKSGSPRTHTWPYEISVGSLSKKNVDC